MQSAESKSKAAGWSKDAQSHPSLGTSKSLQEILIVTNAVSLLPFVHLIEFVELCFHVVSKDTGQRRQVLSLSILIFFWT